MLPTSSAAGLKVNPNCFLWAILPPYGPVAAARVSCDLSACLKKVNRKATGYWLRRTYAQNLLEAGASYYDIKEMLGHDHIESTKQYLSIHIEMMRKVLFDETL